MPDISLLELFCIFFYIGLFTIGGGLVAITLMQQTIVERGLISPDLFYNMVAISESTPGPIGVNMATYLGFHFYGVPGAIITTAGEVLPSLICIAIIAKLLSAFRQNRYVGALLSGIRPASTGLVFVAAINIFILSLLNVPKSFFELKEPSTLQSLFIWPNLAFYFSLLLLRSKIKVHPIVLILLGALFGIAFL